MWQKRPHTYTHTHKNHRGKSKTKDTEHCRAKQDSATRWEKQPTTSNTAEITQMKITKQTLNLAKKIPLVTLARTVFLEQYENVITENSLVGGGRQTMTINNLVKKSSHGGKAKVERWGQQKLVVSGQEGFMTTLKTVKEPADKKLKVK